MSGETRFQIVPVEIEERFIDFRRFRFEVNQRLQRRVMEEIADFHPHVMVCFDLLSAWLAATTSDFVKLAWLGDLNSQTYWYNALYGVKERTIHPSKIVPYLGLIWAQCRMWKRIYRDVLSRMSSIIVSSKSSEKILKSWGLQAKYLPYPWPKGSVSVSTEGKKILKKPTFLFLGSLKGLGSRSAFHFMIRRLYPRLVDLWGNHGFEIIVAGRGGLYEWVEEELKRRPEFRYIGFAEDIEEVMNSCHAVVVPIDVPVGNRSRIITAMANRTLVIAHANTALANPELLDGKTCLLARNVEEFVQKMKEAASASSRILQIVEGGGRVYDENFQPAAACNLFIEEVNKILLARNRWGG
jgi:glycosyltransferase involved in cell wall biosynthesis